MAASDCICKGCGESFAPRDMRYSTYCSRECAFENSSRWHFGEHQGAHTKISFCECRQCGRQLISRRPRGYGSDGCRKATANAKAVAYNKATYLRDRSERQCQECGITFAPVYGDKRVRYCTVVCSDRASERVWKAKRRAVERGAEADSIDPFRVFYRDGWRCQICGKATPKARRGTCSSNAPELDHRVPVSKGGKHTWGNVQCACRACNAAKGNQSEIGQFPLFDQTDTGGGIQSSQLLPL